jgi:radical SAM enzyme (rSAM/lipoprotein system)
MPLEVFLSALDSISSPPKHFIVAITGGEPLLREDLEKAGREIRNRGMRWGIVTNGHLYTEVRHSSLLKAGMGSLTISLDGLEDSHNWLRNNSRSFKRVDIAIDLAASSARLNFDVVTCVNQKNLAELPEIYHYLHKKRVKAWRLFTITPIGRATEHPELNLSGPEFQELIKFIALKRKEGKMDVKFSCEGYVGAYERKVRDTPFFCRAGINIGSVLIDGSISACPNTDRSFAQGNIYQDNLFEVWNQRFKPFRDRSWMRRGKCSDCKDFRNCQGNGFHYWHGERLEPLVCHKELLEN